MGKHTTVLPQTNAYDSRHNIDPKEARVSKVSFMKALPQSETKYFSTVM